MTAIRQRLERTRHLALSIQERMFVTQNARYDAQPKHEYSCKGTKAVFCLLQQSQHEGLVSLANSSGQRAK